MRLRRFFERLRLQKIQEDYFIRLGIDGGGKTLSRPTVKARRRRWGYYKKSPRSEAKPSQPYGVWTGNTLDHTTKKKARVKIKAGEMTLSHKLSRWWIKNYWDLRLLDRWIEPLGDKFLQDVIDGKNSREVIE